ncbi:MAG: helix-turn-helix domain-containing protein [Betaproteobacteria bacterium]|nr:helix-turn-helix domain-containing protein [Betaproteobacteria bacterium]
MTELAQSAPDVGEELAQARRERGLSLADVAQQLKFAARQIEALEQGRFAELPAGTFARGMVRAYARLLKLDPEPLVERIAARVAVPDNAIAVASARRPIPITDQARRTNLQYSALSLVILGVVAVVAFEWQRERSSAARLSFVPAARAPLEPQRTAASSTLASTVTPQITTLEPAEAEAPPAAPPAESQPAGSRHRIVMRFERESWVQIRGGDGKVLTSALNRAGSERSVEGAPPFTLVIGNAQHVRLSYDDRPIDLAPHVKVEVARFTLE